MTICGTDCCEACPKLNECGGCRQCGGHPFGGNCVAAETILAEGINGFEKLKNDLIGEINSLGIPGLHVTDLNLLNGFYVNLEYPLPNGSVAKYLNDRDIYFANQIELPGKDRYFGIVACRAFLLVCEYGCNGADPELVLYKHR